MDKNNLSVRASLDTSKLKKDLEKFEGEVKLKADTNTLRQQLETTIANASQNATADIHCCLSGMDTVMGQLQNAASSNHDISLNVSADTSGLQQYTAQLEKLAQLSSQIQLPTVNSAATQTGSNTPNVELPFISNTATNFKDATTEGDNFFNTLTNVTTAAELLTSTLNMPSAFKSFSKNLD